MKVLVSEKLSEHKYKTPEGYLICTDAILARTGKQSYTKDELFQDGDNTEVNVDRPYDEVMNTKTIASFENKPITFDHPDEDVNVGNYKDYAIGYVRDVHQGKTDKGEDVILGNLVITDQDAINAIEQGDHTDLSCGYDCDIRDDGNGNYSQTNIRGNHLALCEQGRAGIAHIVDSKVKDDARQVIQDLYSKLNNLFNTKLSKYDYYNNNDSAVGISGRNGKICFISVKRDVLVKDNPSKINNEIKALLNEAKSICSKYVDKRIEEDKTVYVGIAPSINFEAGNYRTTCGIYMKFDEINAINDSEVKDSKIEGVSPELLLNLNDWFADKIYIERKYHVKIYNITSNKGLTVTGNRQDLEKLYKDYHLENDYNLKIVDSKVDNSKEMTMSDAIKMLNIVDAYKKVRDASTDKWVIKNTGLVYEIWNQGKMVKKLPTKKLAIEWIHSRFPNDEIIDDSKKVALDNVCKKVKDADVNFLIKGKKVKTNVYNRNKLDFGNIWNLGRKYNVKIERMFSTSDSDFWFTTDITNKDNLFKMMREVNPALSSYNLNDIFENVLKK